MTVLTLPEAESAYLREAYSQAEVILEYGSGGSTRVGAEMPGKLIYSVESDRKWAIRLQAELDAAGLPSPAIVYHVDIGETGAWGRPRHQADWQKFHRLPTAIWDEPFFRHPDLVLIDGRFRAACFATVCLRITRPVRLLFDDYTSRPLYQIVERIARPVRMIGRMAEFSLEPGMIGPEDIGFAISLFFWVTYADEKEVDYSIPAWLIPHQRKPDERPSEEPPVS